MLQTVLLEHLFMHFLMDSLEATDGAEAEADTAEPEEDEDSVRNLHDGKC